MKDFSEIPSQNITYEKITIEDAQIILNEQNRFNRKIKPQHVKKLSEAMLQRKFLYNGDPIRFNTDGILIDGQHRLSAMILANKKDPSITHGYFSVIRGLSDEVADTIDININRNVMDRLSIRIKKHIPPKCSPVLYRMLAANISNIQFDTDTLEAGWSKFENNILFSIEGMKCRHSHLCANIALAHYLKYDISRLNNIKNVFSNKDVDENETFEDLYQPVFWLLDQIKYGNVPISGGKHATKAYVYCQEVVWAVLNNEKIYKISDERLLPMNFKNRFPISD